jgi:nucleotide-binding universal stress UspA family protein
MDSDETVRSDGRAEHSAPRADIVVGIDESRASAAALRWAVAHAKLSGQPLRLVHAWQMSAAASRAVAMGAGAYPEAAAADARARATQWVLETLGFDASEVRWTLAVHEGGAGPVLAAAADSARLVVVGTREHTGLRRAVSGSVSHYVLSHAVGPVVAVPGAGQDEGPARARRSPPVPTLAHP